MSMTKSTKELKYTLPALALRVLKQKGGKLSKSVTQSSQQAKISKSADRMHGIIKRNISMHA